MQAINQSNERITFPPCLTTKRSRCRGRCAGKYCNKFRIARFEHSKKMQCVAFFTDLFLAGSVAEMSASCALRCARSTLRPSIRSLSSGDTSLNLDTKKKSVDKSIIFRRQNREKNRMDELAQRFRNLAQSILVMGEILEILGLAGVDGVQLMHVCLIFLLHHIRKSITFNTGIRIVCEMARVVLFTSNFANSLERASKSATAFSTVVSTCRAILSLSDHDEGRFSGQWSAEYMERVKDYVINVNKNIKWP